MIERETAPMSPRDCEAAPPFPTTITGTIAARLVAGMQVADATQAVAQHPQRVGRRVNARHLPATCRDTAKETAAAGGWRHVLQLLGHLEKLVEILGRLQAVFLKDLLVVPQNIAPMNVDGDGIDLAVFADQLDEVLGKLGRRITDVRDAFPAASKAGATGQHRDEDEGEPPDDAGHSSLGSPDGPSLVRANVVWNLFLSEEISIWLVNRFAIPQKTIC